MPFYVAILALNFFTVFAVRVLVAKRFRIEGVGFWPWSGGRVTLDAVWRGARPLMVLATAALTYAFAVVIFTAAFSFAGEQVSSTRIDVNPGGSAAEAGMLSDDRIVSIEGKPVSTFDDVVTAVQGHPGEPLAIIVRRDGAEMPLTVTPRSVGGVGRIGVTGRPERRDLGLASSLGRGLYEPVNVLGAAARSVGDMVSGRPKAKLSSAVGLTREMSKSAHEGPGELLMFLGVVDAYFWPFFVLISVLIVPRRARS